MGTNGGGSYLCRRDKGQILTSETSKRNQRRNAGFRPKRNTGLVDRTHPRNATRRGVAADLLAGFSRFLGVAIVSADQAECALMKLMVASLTTPLYLGQLTQSQS